LDEVLVSGDLNFQQKILDMLVNLQYNFKMATIICSHNPQTLYAFADEFYLMDRGQMKQISKKMVAKMSLDSHYQFHKTFKSIEIFSK